MPNTVDLRNRVQDLLQHIELSTGQKQLPEMKRACTRYTWIAPATIEFVDHKDFSEPVFITTRTISAQSLDFRSPRIPKPGCKVLINLETDIGELRIPGTVVHSTASVGMSITAVKFCIEQEPNGSEHDLGR